MDTPNTGTFTAMDHIFGTAPEAPAPMKEYPITVPVVITDKVGEEEQENDFASTRETLHRLLEKSEEALDDLLRLSKQSEHPRTFEVAGQLIKTVADVAQQVVDLHKKKKEISGAGTGREARLNGGASIAQQNNIVFNGSASDLLDMIERQKANVIENGEG